MRLLELHLQAFGPFTDRRIDLSAGEQGLHLLHGPNEAGKSSALRALHSLLFGIPARTTDDFVHGARDLRIGARLRNRGGHELICYRRKGNKNTLLAEDQTPIPEDALAAMLGGMDAAGFQRLFGIDHQTLVSGGAELLAERGAAADALFGAGIGNLNLRALTDALTNEAGELFRPRASAPTLNQALSEYHALERELKAATLPSQRWRQAAGELADASQVLESLGQEILKAESRRNQLERVRRTQPRLARLDALQAQRMSLGAIRPLPEDFSERRRRAERDLHQAITQGADAATRLIGLRRQTGELSVNQPLIAEAEAVEQLIEELGGYRKANAERPGVAAQHQHLIEQARRELSVARPDLPLAQAESLRPLLSRRRATQALANEGNRLKAALDQAERNCREIGRQLGERERALAGQPEPPATAALADALAAARQPGDLDQRIAEIQLDLTTITHQARHALAAAGLWSGQLEDLRDAALPSDADIGGFITRKLKLDQDAERLAEEEADCQAEQAKAAECLHALQLSAQVPTEADLTQARAQRQALWQRIKINCFGSDTATAPTEPADQSALPEAFEISQSQADGIADRLRREAASVHQLASAQASLSRQQTRATELKKHASEQQARAQAFAEDWSALWASLGITPGSPERMRDWCATLRPLVDQVRHGDSLQLRLESLHTERDRLRHGLAEALDGILPSPSTQTATLLAPLLQRAERQLDSLHERHREHVRLRQACQEFSDRTTHARTDVDEARRQLEQWQASWAARLGELGLPTDQDADSVADDFQRLTDLFGLLDQAEFQHQRLAAIDRDALSFQQRASAMLERLAPDLGTADLDSALAELRQRLVREREARSRLDALMTQQRAAEDEVRSAAAREAAARATLTELCQLTNCASPDDLAEHEARALELARCQTELDALQTELRAAGDGRSLDKLREEAARFDPDTLSAELDGLDRQLRLEWRPREHAAIENKLRCQEALDAMDGSGQAAQLAEALARCRARLLRLSRQWIRLRFASRLLQDAKHSYAERHRDPLLPLIAGYFQQLTEGAFSCVEVDLDQGDQPVLVVQRAGGERLTLPALSTGTRDQLYLALRLATLEQRAARNEPLPFILDDILVQFDDRRSRATLRTLADFSRQTQVILFTHHQYVVELARGLQAEADSAARIFIHAL